MEKTDDRIFFTECLVQAILQLAREKPFAEISVTELCQKAGVSRMTFYRSFHSKEEALYRYVDWIVEKYKREIVRDKGFAAYIRMEYIVLIFTYFSTYRELIDCMVKHHIDDYLRKKFVQTELNLTMRSDFDAQSRYMAVAYANALYGVLTEWLCSGSMEDAAVPAGVVFDTFKERVRRY